MCRLAFLLWHKRTLPLSAVFLFTVEKAVVIVNIILCLNVRKNLTFSQGNSPATFVLTLLSADHGTRWRTGLHVEWSGYKNVWIIFQDECHNFIKVLLKKNDDTLFVCGTNAFNPSCRNYKVNAASSVGTTRRGGISYFTVIVPAVM